MIITRTMQRDASFARHLDALERERLANVRPRDWRTRGLQMYFTPYHPDPQP